MRVWRRLVQALRLLHNSQKLVSLLLARQMRDESVGHIRKHIEDNPLAVACLSRALSDNIDDEVSFDAKTERYSRSSLEAEHVAVEKLY